MYTTAIEPNTTIPGQGISRARARGGVPLALHAGETREAQLELHLPALGHQPLGLLAQRPLALGARLL